MKETIWDEIQEIIDTEIRLYPYRNLKFPVGIRRAEIAWEIGDRKMVVVPKNSLMIMPPKYENFSAHFHALVFPDWESMTYNVWLRRELIGESETGTYKSREINIAMQNACEQLLQALKFGGEEEDNSRELLGFFDDLKYMPKNDWDAYR